MNQNEKLKLEAWKKSAKGKPTKWRYYRDAIALLSLGWMTTGQFQVAMRRLYAVKNRTSRDILEELQQEKSVVQERDPKDQLYKWGATREGVSYWINHVSAIPAGIVTVALTMQNVSVLEV